MGAWEIVSVEEGFTPGEFAFYDSEVGYLTGLTDFDSVFRQYYILYRTLDGGKTWAKIRFTGINDDTRLISTTYYISIPDRNSIYLLRKFSPFTVLRSFDQGATWDQINITGDYGDDYRTMFTSASGFWFDWSNGRIFLTRDSCRTYSDVLEDSLFKLASQFELKGGSGPYAGWYTDRYWIFPIMDTSIDDGKGGISTLVTFNSGMSWKKQYFPLPGFETDTIIGTPLISKKKYICWLQPEVSQVRNNTLYGKKEITFMTSTDFGLSWRVDTSFMDRAAAFAGVSADEAWMSVCAEPFHDMLGNGSKTPHYILVHTTDHGKSWEVDSLSLRSLEFGKYDCFVMHFTDKDHGWLAARNSQSGKVGIFRYIPATGDVSVESKGRHLAKGYKIYPNPSNGLTTITFSSPKSISSVEVYDILGRNYVPHIEIKGSTIEIDARGLPIGAYRVFVHHSGGRSSVPLVVTK